MSLAPNLTLISEVLPVQRRDFTLTDPTILNPNATNPKAKIGAAKANFAGIIAISAGFLEK